MPVKAALVALVGGVVLLVGSCAPIGLSAYRSFFSDPVSTTPLKDGRGASGRVRVTPGKLARIAIEAQIETPSVQEVDESGKKRYKPRYRFPVSYVVLDGAGRQLQSRTETLAWDEGSRTITKEDVSSTGGRLTVRRSFEKFTAPPSGEVEVEAQLGEDGTYKAAANGPQLLVFGGLENETPWVVSGIAMLVVGALLAMVGLIFTVVTLATSPAGAGPAAGDVTASADSRKHATLCHLSGFLAYVLPPFNLVLTAVLWMLWRDGDEFVDDQGREALNFQISLLIYYLVSALLVLVLIGIVLLIALSVFQIVFLIVAAVTCAKGERYRYPMTLRILK